MNDAAISLLSVVGELIQVMGVLMIGLLFIMMYRVLMQPYMLYWAKAWASLFFSLFALHLSFTVNYLKWMQFFYFFLEYIFALFLWQGLSNFSRNEPLRKSLIGGYWVAGAFVAAMLTFGDDQFSPRFQIHALIFIVTLIPSVISAARMPLPGTLWWAKHGIFSALVLLIVNFSVGIFSSIGYAKLGNEVMSIYTAYQSIIDLSFETLLAFNLVSIAMISVRSQLQDANRALMSQRDLMQELAHHDALTGCFNRHLLPRLYQDGKDREGVVVVIDINDLKPLNDGYGHAVGDLAIKTVADVVKRNLRLVDSLIRAGGDEFILVAFDAKLDDITRRLSSISRELQLNPSALPMPVSISWGVESFNSETNLELAISKADSLMYAHKVKQKAKHTT